MNSEYQTPHPIQTLFYLNAISEKLTFFFKPFNKNLFLRFTTSMVKTYQQNSYI